MTKEASYEKLRSQVSPINAVSMTHNACKEGVVLSTGHSSILIPSETLEKMFREMCKVQGLEVKVRAREERFYGRDR